MAAKKSKAKTSASQQPGLDLGPPAGAPTPAPLVPTLAPLGGAPTPAPRLGASGTLYDGVPQGALAAGDDAWGLRRWKSGFGKSTVDDHLFALGYPALPLLDESDVKAPSGVVACGRLIGNLVDAEVMPKAGALRLIRGADLGSQLQMFVDQWEDNGRSLEAGEADKLVDAAFLSYDGQRTVKCLEALTSSDAVLTRAAAALDKAPLEDWHGDGNFEANATGVIFRLWELLLRASTATSEKARASLEATFARAAHGQDGFYRPLKALDLVLHGRAAIERKGDPPRFYELAFVDDAAYVKEHAIAALAKMRAIDRELPDARIVFVGGDDVKQAFIDSDGKWNSVYAARFERQVARFS